MAGVPVIDVAEALRLLELEGADDTGLESPKDIFADFKSIREMWNEAKAREVCWVLWLRRCGCVGVLGAVAA